MKRRTLLMNTLALALVLLGSTDARANLISWGYDWTASPNQVSATGGSIDNKITLSNETFHVAVGNSSVVASNLKAFSTANPLTPDTFLATDGNYTLKITLTDIDSGMTGFLLFTGQLQGTFSEFNAIVSNTFFFPTTQAIGLGTNFYTVSLNAYTPPGLPAQGNLGSIGAFVQVESLKDGRVPEPSSFLLAGLGVGFLGLGAWRRSRRRLTLTN